MDQPTSPTSYAGDNASEKKPTDRGTRREQFDLCIAMLKAYYDALEGRLEKALATLVIVIGWLVTSDSARRALAASTPLLATATVTLTALVGMYIWSAVHWVSRFRGIQASVDALKYMDDVYYTRYRFTSRVTAAYVVPVLVLYAFALALIVLSGFGQLPTGDATSQTAPSAKTDVVAAP